MYCFVRFQQKASMKIIITIELAEWIYSSCKYHLCFKMLKTSNGETLALTLGSPPLLTNEMCPEFLVTLLQQTPKVIFPSPPSKTQRFISCWFPVMPMHRVGGLHCPRLLSAVKQNANCAGAFSNGAWRLARLAWDSSAIGQLFKSQWPQEPSPVTWCPFKVYTKLQLQLFSVIFMIQVINQVYCYMFLVIFLLWSIDEGSLEFMKYININIKYVLTSSCLEGWVHS